MGSSPGPLPPTDATMRHFLRFLAGEFTEGSSPAAAADLLGEVLTVLQVYGDVRRGCPPASYAVKDKSRAMLRFEVALGAALRESRAMARKAAPPGSQSSPSGLPAGLEVPDAAAGRGSVAAAVSAANEITLREAADLLGLTPEGVRWLIQRGVIAGHQEAAGKRRWRADLASVLACKQRRSA